MSSAGPSPSQTVPACRGFVRQQHCTAAAAVAPSENPGTSKAWRIRNGHGKLSGQQERRHGGDPGPAGPPTDRHCPSVGLGSMARYQPLPLPRPPSPQGEPLVEPWGRGALTPHCSVAGVSPPQGLRTCPKEK